jgi:hypothetical protein
VIEHRLEREPRRSAQKSAASSRRQAEDELLRDVDVDVVRTHLLLVGRNRILRARGIELAAVPGAIVPRAQEQRALDILLEAPHRDALGPRHPARTPLAGQVEP